MKHAVTMLSFVMVASTVGCATEAPFAVATDTQALNVCPGGPIVKGIDVSKYQGTIDWNAVVKDDVTFAYIRVSDGLKSKDGYFASNWAGARRAGVLRGAYQFFRPGQDALAQAKLMVEAIGTLAADDLTPVIDVETDDGRSPTVVLAGIRTWLDYVARATGRTPMIYTGRPFWEDTLGNADLARYPLWHAQYPLKTPAATACPNIASAWSRWAVWQYTDKGAVAGIKGGVDVNRYNGDRANLLAELGASAVLQGCAPVPAEGRVIDERDACFEGGGDASYLREVTDAGYADGLLWTYGTQADVDSNYGRWSLDLTAGGRYRVDVFLAAAHAETSAARYVVQGRGAPAVVEVNQLKAAAAALTAAESGWHTLGEFEFGAGPGQFVYVGDATGEAGQHKIVLDAVRLVPLDLDDESTSQQLDLSDVTTGGCQGTPAGAGLTPLFFAAIRRRRRWRA